MTCVLLDCYNNVTLLFTRTCLTPNTSSFLGVASACPLLEVLLYGRKSPRGTRFVRCPEFRGCPYLGGRNVLKVYYDRLGAGSLSVLRRLSASRSVRYRRFHCIYFFQVDRCKLEIFRVRPLWFSQPYIIGLPSS